MWELGDSDCGYADGYCDYESRDYQLVAALRLRKFSSRLDIMARDSNKRDGGLVCDCIT